MRRVELPPGLATSIGSLPHRTSADAVRFVLAHHPDLPAAPSIPLALPVEGMIAQAAWGMAGVTVRVDGSIGVERRAFDPASPLGDEDLHGPPFATLRTFLRAVSDRGTPIKLQLTGPVTLAMALRAEGVPCHAAVPAAASAVRQRARQLLALAHREAADAPLVVFVDEPGLVAGTDPGLPLCRDAVIDMVSGALAALEPHAITGLHCCGRADWPGLLQAGPQVLSCPVDAGLEPAAGHLASFLERGGWIAWGAVPTGGPRGDRTSRLWRRLSSLWCELVQAGCDAATLRQQAMVTPTCGMALLGEVQAASVMASTLEIARRLHDVQVGSGWRLDA